VAKFGKSSWELDALKPEILINLTESAIQEYLDIPKYKAVIAQEKKDTKALQETSHLPHSPLH
jgi:hypothetical protein